jgi:hypothetical protein
MANLKLKNPSGGSLNLVSADGASDLTVTFPAATGTAMVSVNMPAFSATMSVTQSTTAGVQTKLQFDTEEFDTNSNYNTSTYRFTPTVAGYYQINLGVYQTAGGTTQVNMYIYKNGASYKGSAQIIATNQFPVTSSIVYCNGTTDYIEAYAAAYTAAGAFQTGGFTYFNGCMVRAA